MIPQSPTAQPPRPAGLAWLPWAFTGAAIVAQIAWPLTRGDARVATTGVVVVLFAAAAVSHAGVYRGVRWAAAYSIIAVLFGLAVEMVGVHTGWPFSPYSYTDVLQPQVFDVPMLVPLAWTMMAYPALTVGTTLAQRRGWRIVIGAFALSCWDLFLDPQMVGEGYWVWESELPGLPGIDTIPIVNYLGWFAVSLVLMIVLTALPNTPAPLGVPAVLYGWTWLGGIIANAFFLGRPAVALWGGVVMGIVAVPFLLRVVATLRSPDPALTTSLPGAP